MPTSERAIASPPSSKGSKNSKINNIQMLRAFAALSVVFFHTGYMPGGHGFGWFGVDIFFVISGYIMTRICDRNPQFFLRRRLIRIVPPYWAFTVLLFIAAIFFPALMGFTRAQPVFLLKSLLFIPFFKSPGNIEPILFLGWTLNFEMFFYVSVALGIWLFRRRPILLASLIVIATTLACRTWGRGGAITLFYSNWVVLEFLIGAVAYYIARAVTERAAQRFRMLFVAGMIASTIFFVAYQATVLTESRVPLGIASFVMVLSAVLLSKSGWDADAFWIVLAGDSSYMLYLVHPYCISIFDRIIVKHLHFLDTTRIVGSLTVCSSGFDLSASQAGSSNRRVPEPSFWRPPPQH